jgi:hypothetical protein
VPISDTEMLIKFPKLPEGSSLGYIKISQNLNSFSEFTLTSNLEVHVCPDGEICDLTSSTPCDSGELCGESQLGGQALKCPPGYYQDIDHFECTPCPQGSYCPGSGLSSLTNTVCPDGKVCSNITNALLADLDYCPEGQVCDTPITDYTNLPTPIACPNGYWCG